MNVRQLLYAYGDASSSMQSLRVDTFYYGKRSVATLFYKHLLSSQHTTAKNGTCNNKYFLKKWSAASKGFSAGTGRYKTADRNIWLINCLHLDNLILDRSIASLASHIRGFPELTLQGVGALVVPRSLRALEILIKLVQFSEVGWFYQFWSAG